MAVQINKQMNATETVDPETVVLGSLCKSAVSRKEYLDKVDKDDFNIKTYGKIFEAVLSLVQGGLSVNSDSVTGFFTEVIDKMQVSFLFDPKVDTTITPEIFQAFKKGGVRARQIKLKNLLVHELNKVGDPDALTEMIRSSVATLEGQDAQIEAVSMDTTVDSATYLLDQWAKGDRPVVSGLPELDERLFLSQFIGYWVIAGNSGAGKTALMCNIAKENGRRGIPGTICSLEMSKDLLLIRMAMEDPKVRGLELTDRSVKDKQKMSDLKIAMDSYRRMPIHIIDGVSDIFRLDKISRKLATEYGCKWTLFDYIQLGKTKPTDSDVVRVYTVSRYLQGLTRIDLANGYKGQAVIALSQYSNEATKARNDIVTSGEENNRGQREQKRKPPRPTNSDLAWSGQIKQDADGILHLYPVGNMDDDVLDIELHCGKQRNYKSGWTVPVRFVKAQQTFETDMSIRRSNSPDPGKPVEVRKATF